MTSLLISIAFGQLSGAPLEASHLTVTTPHFVLTAHQQETPGEASLRLARIEERAREARNIAERGDPEGALEHLGEDATDPYMLSKHSWTLMNIYIQLGDWHKFLQVAEYNYAEWEDRRGVAGVPPVTKVNRAIGLYMTGQEQRAWQEMEWDPLNYEWDLHGDTLSNTEWRTNFLRLTPETHIIDLAYYHCIWNRDSFAGPLALQQALYERYPNDQHLQFLYGKNVLSNKTSPILEGEGDELARMLLQKASLGENLHIASESRRLLAFQKAQIAVERGK